MPGETVQSEREQALNGAGAAHRAARAPSPDRPMADLPANPKYVVEEENRALLANLGRPRTVLDVGCGIGLNGAAARRKGARVTGIEIVPASIERARKVLDEVLAMAADAIAGYVECLREDGEPVPPSDVGAEPPWWKSCASRCRRNEPQAAGLLCDGRHAQAG